MTRSSRTALFAAALLPALVAGLAHQASACPFCAGASLTLAEEIGSSDVAVIARLVKLPPPAPGKGASTLGSGSDSGKARFEILQVLKGAQALNPVDPLKTEKALKGEKSPAPTRFIETLYFGNSPVGSLFLLMGVEPPDINWSTPIAISERARPYLVQSLELPKEGADRLAYFQEFLEDDDELLARDAYDEFAKAPYADVKGLKDRMHHEKLLTWIEDPKLAPSRRRLYLTMLGICGQPADADRLESILKSDDRQVKQGLDAAIAAYLTLKGEAGMPLVENLFLKNQDADYVETIAAVMAIRFQGQEEKSISRDRLLQGLRFMLERPQLADQIIPDLARWQDWSSMDRLVELFKNANEDSIWVRVPVINYLRACPLPEAKKHLDELAALDPDNFKKATAFNPVITPAGEEKPADDKAADNKKPAEKSDASSSGGDKNVTDKAPAPAPSGKKTSRSSNKPVLSGPATASTSPASGQLATRLSRASAPSPLKLSQVTVWHVLGWMALASGVVGVFLLAILRGGQHVT